MSCKFCEHEGPAYVHGSLRVPTMDYDNTFSIPDANPVLTWDGQASDDMPRLAVSVFDEEGNPEELTIPISHCPVCGRRLPSCSDERKVVRHLKYTEADERTVEEMWRSGRTINEIGERLGRSVASIHSYMSRHRDKYPVRVPRVTTAQAEEMREMRARGCTREAVAERFGVSLDTVDTHTRGVRVKRG